MIIYSDVTGKTYDSVEDCEKAEKKYKEEEKAKAAKEAEEEEKIEEARDALEEALENYRDVLKESGRIVTVSKRNPFSLLWDFLFD